MQQGCTITLFPALVLGICIPEMKLPARGFAPSQNSIIQGGPIAWQSDIRPVSHTEEQGRCMPYVFRDGRNILRTVR